jgi:hypothetical protein
MPRQPSQPPQPVGWLAARGQRSRVAGARSRVSVLERLAKRHPSRTLVDVSFVVDARAV